MDIKLVEVDIITIASPVRIPGCNIEAWEWGHDGPWPEIAPTKEQALIDQREYVMEMLS